MLAQSRPKHPNKTEQEKVPEPGYLANAAQRKQAEIKTSVAGAKMQERGLRKLNIHGLGCRDKLPDEPHQWQNHQPTRSVSLEPDDANSQDDQGSQHPITPGDWPGIEHYFPKAHGHLDKTVENHRIAELNQGHAEKGSRQTGEHFWPNSGVGGWAFSHCWH